MPIIQTMEMWPDLKLSDKLDVTSKEYAEYKVVSNSPWDIRCDKCM